MIKITSFAKNTASVLLSGVILLTSGGFIASGIKEEIKKDANKNLLIETAVENEEKFSEQYSAYNKYIKLICNEIIETNMHTSAVDVFSSYIYLQNNGLISLGDEFNFETPDYEVVGNLGMSVISGKSVCRNEAYNLCNIFRTLGYEASVCHGELYTSKFISGTNNHAVVGVKENGKYYLFDPTNNTIFLHTATFQFRSIDRENEKFYPSIYGDEVFSTLKDNTGIHFYIGDDYRKKEEFIQKRDVSYEKSLNNSEYYEEYEDEYLKELEEMIDSSMMEYVSTENNKSLK